LDDNVNIALLSIHSSPLATLGAIDTGGMSTFILELTREIDKLGHKVDIFTCAGKEDHAPVLSLHKNSRLISLNRFSDSLLGNNDFFHALPLISGAIQHFCNRENNRYDIIHSHYWLSGRLGNLLQEKWSLPHVTMFHTLGLLKDEAARKEIESEGRIIQEKRVVDECHKIIAPTALEKQHLVKNYAVEDNKITVIPGGVDTKLFQIGDQQEARLELGINNDDSILLYVGRFAPLKRIDLLISTLPFLNEKNNVKLLIIGGGGSDDPYCQDLIRLVKKSELADSVNFIGNVSHHKLPLYFNAADLSVLPSYYESFGLVCLESLACGTPVVAGDTGIMASILDGRINGRAVPDLYQENLAAVIKEFLPQKRTDASIKEKIRSSVLRFSWENAAAATIDLFESFTKKSKINDEIC
jgi:D-inositol-3-phosphate glycosyltransferase